MSDQSLDFIKQREVFFCALHPDPRQAHNAAEMLSGYPGILMTEARSNLLLEVHYNLLELTFSEILQIIERHGFHLENGLMSKLRRALFQFTEETQRANLGCDRGDSNCTKKVFATEYRRQNHGCRDQRPEHWRRYL
jgi:hypothetical protein